MADVKVNNSSFFINRGEVAKKTAADNPIWGKRIFSGERLEAQNERKTKAEASFEKYYA